MKLEFAAVLNLLHGASASTLATHALQMPGYPYATVVPNVLDEQHCPLLLVSALAEHTKNLLANPKVSLSVVAGGNTPAQEGPRLTLLGDAERFDASPALIHRYARYVPAAEQYLALDFMFFRIRPKRIRYIGGVGRMGWVEYETLVSGDTLELSDEALLLAKVQTLVPRHVSLLGLDPYGIDYQVEGVRKREPLAGEDFKAALLSVLPTLN